MNLDKAIEILTNWKEEGVYEDAEELNAAEQLGIEALKRCQLARKETSFVGPGLLPGETPPSPLRASVTSTDDYGEPPRRPK